MTRIGVCLTAVLLAAVPGAAIAAAKHHEAHRAAAASKPASAATRTLGKSGAWAAYASDDQTGRVCYLLGEPQKSEPASFPRKTPMAMVTHRPAEKISNVVSFVEGYPLKEGSSVALDVGHDKFELFTNGDSAWARTAELDSTIVTALARSKRAVVKGTPQKGPGTTDIYELDGFPQALALIDKACGIGREKPKPHPAPVHRHKPKTKKAAHRT